MLPFIDKMMSSFMSAYLSRYSTQHVLIEPQGVDLAYLQTGISGVFCWVLNFQNLYFFGYWSQLLYFFGLLNKSCILKCFIFQQYFWVQFYSPGASIIMGLYYYHIMLDFCEMNVFEGIF